ncbi:capsid protein [Bacillus phage BCPST]|uniref:Capsid protein n=1 Tax=Bacillus phage BCPST TaxID=2801506 RepID=A0AAE7P3W8_9CAUD|nr:capsid protein [Bacillus phage BCPST]QQO38706.1 capsid protein [Bacillus phage BCPST]QSJ04297.1 capsid protein [Bacillus phage BCP6]
MPSEFVMILVKTILLVGGSIPPLTHTDYIMVSKSPPNPLRNIG